MGCEITVCAVDLTLADGLMIKTTFAFRKGFRLATEAAGRRFTPAARFTNRSVLTGVHAVAQNLKANLRIRIPAYDNAAEHNLARRAI
jgi:hypothetical protein